MLWHKSRISWLLSITLNPTPTTRDLSFDFWLKAQGWRIFGSCQKHIKRWSLHYDFMKCRIRFQTCLTWLGTCKTIIHPHLCCLVSWKATADGPGFSSLLLVLGSGPPLRILLHLIWYGVCCLFSPLSALRPSTSPHASMRSNRSSNRTTSPSKPMPSASSPT